MTLAEYLTKRKLTYAAFAAKLGIGGRNPGMTVFRYATGKRLPRPDMAAKIVKATRRKVKLSDIYAVE
jgi:hypothetical protein